jgi:hypothetical protein
MRKVGLLICALVALSFVSQAQRKWSVGAKGGISIPNLRAPKDDVGFNGGYKSVLGPQAGVLVEYRFNKKWSLQTGFNYSTQGGEKKGDQRVGKKLIEVFISGYALPDYLYARFNNRIELEYIELPLMAKYSLPLNKHARLSAMLGPYFGQMIKATDIVSGGMSTIFRNPTYNDTFKIKRPGGAISDSIPLSLEFERTEDVIDQFHRLNYGVQGGLYFGYSIKRIELFLASEGTYGLRFLQKDERFGKNETGGITLSGGVMIGL